MRRRLHRRDDCLCTFAGVEDGDLAPEIEHAVASLVEHRPHMLGQVGVQLAAAYTVRTLDTSLLELLPLGLYALRVLSTRRIHVVALVIDGKVGVGDLSHQRAFYHNLGAWGRLEIRRTRRTVGEHSDRAIRRQLVRHDDRAGQDVLGDERNERIPALASRLDQQEFGSVRPTLDCFEDDSVLLGLSRLLVDRQTSLLNNQDTV